MLLIALALALPIGLVVGLLGGGGSILTLPVLVYGLGMATKDAIATALLVVGATSAVGALHYARTGRVQIKTAVAFGSFAMLGAYLGGRCAGYVPGWVLLALFAGLMLVAAAAMLRPGPALGAHRTTPDAKKLAFVGFVVGALTGTVGAGGGFVVVPALVLLAGLDMRTAVGTSLLIIAFNSFAGLLGYLGHASVDFSLAAVLAIPTIIGSYLGASLSGRIPAARLRRGFAYFIIALALAMVYQSIPAGLLSAVVVAYWPLVLAGAAALIVAGSTLRLRRQAS